MSGEFVNRRAAMAVLAAAATLPAAVAVAGATNPDAELIEAGREYDRLAKIYETVLKKEEPCWQAREADIRGLKEKGPYSDAELVAVIERAEREHPLPSPNGDQILNLMDPIAKKILALPAHTLGGLAVKARVARFACSSFWHESDEDADWDILVARKLIEAVERVAAATV